MPTFGLSSARAEASRRNGAKSRGPKTREGKARSAQNALKHGLCAQKHVVLPDEDAASFALHEAALMDELAPRGALQTVLAQRIVAAAWRLSRAERIEVELFAENGLPGGSLGLALIRDGRRAGAFGTLVRYRGGALAEFWRALRTLKALQAEAAPQAEAAVPHGRTAALAQQRNEPERRRNPGDLVAPTVPVERDLGELRPATWWLQPWPAEPALSVPAAQGRGALPHGRSLLAGTALVPAALA
jgi:hypothetical protein